jgi:hypothetical protein
MPKIQNIESEICAPLPCNRVLEYLAPSFTIKTAFANLIQGTKMDGVFLAFFFVLEDY